MNERAHNIAHTLRETFKIKIKKDCFTQHVKALNSKLHYFINI